MIIVCASYISNNHSRMKEFRYGILPFILILAPAAGLLVLQSHLSATIIVCLLVFSMMLLTGQSNYREVSRIRRILEQEAFVQAVRLKNPEVLKRLKAEIKEMQIPEKTAEHDRRFHQELIRAGENQLLVAVMESLSGLCEEEIAHVQNEAKNEDWCQIHEEIVNALEEGNMEKGLKWIRRHYDKIDDTLIF